MQTTTDKINMLDEKISNKLIGLLVMCPCYKYLKDCPFKDIRSDKNSTEAKVSWIMGLEIESANKLIMQCDECQDKRLKRD